MHNVVSVACEMHLLRRLHNVHLNTVSNRDSKTGFLSFVLYTLTEGSEIRLSCVAMRYLDTILLPNE